MSKTVHYIGLDVHKDSIARRHRAPEHLEPRERKRRDSHRGQVDKSERKL